MTGKTNPVWKIPHTRVRNRSLIRQGIQVRTFSQTEPFLRSVVDTQSGLGRMQYSLTTPFINSVRDSVTSRDSPKCGSATRK